MPNRVDKPDPFTAEQLTVNEEVRDPRDASRAGFITLLSVLGLFLLGSVAFQRVLSDRELTESDDVPRFAALGATANLQPLWAAHEPQMDELTIPFLGAERAGWQYPFGSLHRTGATLAAGSDWPVSSPDPVLGVHVAVNRALPGSPGPVFLPKERLDLRTAVTAYTAGSAYVNRLDDTGAVRPGALADLVVLDRDPFAGPPEEIHEARVDLTLVEGEAVHEASGT